MKKDLHLKKTLRTAMIVLLLSVVGMAKGYTDVVIGDLIYNLDEDALTASVIGHKDGTNATGSLTIPSTVTYTSEEYENGQFVSITRTYTVTSIQERFTGGIFGEWVGAFQGCSGLSGSLTIPNTITTIGNYVFNDCIGFTGNLIIPNSVTTIGSNAFGGCTNLKGSLTIGNSVTSISSGAFMNCGFTGSLSIPNSVTLIGIQAFSDCSGFTGSLTLGNSVTTIESYAFQNCDGFTGDLIIPNSVTEIGDYAFQGCSNFTGNLTIGDSVITIGQDAFRGCSGFSGSLTIGNSVTTIEAGAFSRCSGFTGDLVIPNSVRTIKGGYTSFFGYYFPAAFQGCSGFNGKLIIPNSVTEIGSYAFKGCSGFSEVQYNAAVTNYSADPFSGCGGSLIIGDDVEQIPQYMFQNGDFTGSLIIGSSVVKIGFYAFGGCNGLDAVYYKGDIHQWCNISFLDDYSNPLCCAGNLFIDNKLVKDLVIPNTVTEVQPFAFCGATCLTTLTIPNSVTTIGQCAFYNCSGLTSITVLAETPPSIGEYVNYNVNPSIPVTVLCGYKTVYEASEWANYFTNIEEECESHDIIVDGNISGGDVNVSMTSANLGEEVQLTITPDEGMMLASLTISNASDPDQTFPFYPIGKGSATYGFIMPPVDVVVKALFIVGNAIDVIYCVKASVNPNPVSDIIYIEASNLRHVSIFNALGQQVYDSSVDGDVLECDLSRRVAGVYLVRMETAKGIATKRVVVTK